MNVTKVSILGGIASKEVEIQEKKSSYTGAWYMVVETDDDIHYCFECLVPGRPDSLAGAVGISGDWSRNEYLLSMERTTAEGNESPITAREASELRAVLKDMKEGKLIPVSLFGKEITKNYSDRVVDFLTPRIEIAAKHYVEGKAIASFREIESELHSPPDVPTVSRI